MKVYLHVTNTFGIRFHTVHFRALLIVELRSRALPMCSELLKKKLSKHISRNICSPLLPPTVL